MIFFLVTRDHSYTVSEYFQTWGRGQRFGVRSIYYDQIPYMRNMERGAYIFADLERLDAAQMELASALYRTLSSADRSLHVLNDPAKVLRREALLRELHRRGLNPFAVYRVGDDFGSMKFPVFLRQVNSHDGSMTDLLKSREELDRELEAARGKGVPADDLLIVEYCPTADSHGVFRKYSAFRVAGRVLPRHVAFGVQWVLKFGTENFVTPETVTEEDRYMAEHPHEKELAEIFELANIDYGRIDYSLLDGMIVTWEINTNPMIVSAPMTIAPLRLPASAHFAMKFSEVMTEIDTAARVPRIPFQPPAELLRRLNVRRSDVLLRRAGLALRRLGQRAPWKKMMLLSNPHLPAL
jgi:hypothetical protein